MGQEFNQFQICVGCGVQLKPFVSVPGLTTACRTYTDIAIATQVRTPDVPETLCQWRSIS
jgi:hypothetical protein